MPASGVRCTFVYRMGDFAISETLTYNQPVDLALAVPPAVELMKARIGLSGYGLVPKFIRLSKENVFRDSVVVSPANEGIQPTALRNFTSANDETTTNASDQAKAAMLVRCDSGTFHRKALYLAGIPDCVISTFPLGGPIQNQPQWAPLWNKYKNLLINRPWGFVVVKGVNDGAVQVQTRAVVTQAGTGLIGVVAPAPALNPGASKVQLRNFRRSHPALPSLNGRWQVSEILTDSPSPGLVTYFLLNSSNVSAASVTYTGTIEVLDFITLSITDVALEDATTRKRGNRVLASPGRRRIKKPLVV